MSPEVDGGTSWQRGMAIDVALAPNPAVINLLGGGNIYGNIDINSDDVINVDNGETSFDGIINPEFLPVGGVTAADLDSGLFGQGPLNITADGACSCATVATSRPLPPIRRPVLCLRRDLQHGPGATLIYELATSNTAAPSRSAPIRRSSRRANHRRHIDDLVRRPSTGVR